MKDVEVEDTRGVTLTHALVVTEPLFDSKFDADSKDADGELVKSGDCEFVPDEEKEEERDAVDV